MDFLLNVCIHYCSFISIFIRDKFSAGIELRNRMEKHRMDEKYRVFFFNVCIYLRISSPVKCIRSTSNKNKKYEEKKLNLTTA